MEEACYMAKTQSEYEVENIFIEQLESIGYPYVQMNNYNVLLLLQKKILI